MDKAYQVAYAKRGYHDADDGGSYHGAVFEFGDWVAIAEAQIYGMPGKRPRLPVFNRVQQFAVCRDNGGNRGHLIVGCRFFAAKALAAYSVPIASRRRAQWPRIAAFALL